MALWVRIPRSLPASCSGVCSGRLLLGVSRESGRPLSREHLVSLAPHASPSPLPLPPQPFSSPRPLPSSACSSPGRGSKRTRSRPSAKKEAIREVGERVRGGKAGPDVLGGRLSPGWRAGTPSWLRCGWRHRGHAAPTPPHPVPHSRAPHSAGTLPHWAHVTAFPRAGRTGKGAAAGTDVCRGAMCGWVLCTWRRFCGAVLQSWVRKG